MGVIRAYGHVVTLNADGTSEFADELTLDDKMRAGVALGFSARLQQNVKIAGATALKRNENVQELNKAIYTPCPICVGDTPKTPTWSISADRVVQDKARRIVYYTNARIHVLGATVLFLPVFWHADPQAERASGFLAPNLGASDRRGFSYEQPYLWVISPYSDLVLSPQFNTKVNPFMNAKCASASIPGTSPPASASPTTRTSTARATRSAPTPGAATSWPRASSGLRPTGGPASRPNAPPTT